MSSLRTPRNDARALHQTLLLLLLLFSASIRSEAQSYSAGDGEYVVRPYPCWTMTMEFYDPKAFPYYGVGGYYFDANPFQGYRFVNSNDRILMRSSKAAAGGTSFTGLYPLRDVSGRKIWTDARILVQCYVKESFFGFLSQTFAVVATEFGEVEDATMACSGSPTTFASYNPYDPDESGYSGSCAGTSSGGGNTGSGGGGGGCQVEWLVLERSDDGGATWYVIWEGWGTVCG